LESEKKGKTFRKRKKRSTKGNSKNAHLLLLKKKAASLEKRERKQDTGKRKRRRIYNVQEKIGDPRHPWKEGDFPRVKKSLRIQSSIWEGGGRKKKNRRVERKKGQAEKG